MASIHDLVIEPDEWPERLVQKFLETHPKAWRNHDPELSTEDFLRTVLSGLANDFEGKHRILAALPLTHAVQARKITSVLNRGQQEILEKLKHAPSQALRHIANNVETVFGLLDLWQNGLPEQEENQIKKQIMARKFIKHPDTAYLLRDISLHFFLTAEIFQPLLDTASAYEQCRQPMPIIYREGVK